MSRKVRRAKSGAYYVITKSGRSRFVKKPGRKKKKRVYRKVSKFWGRFR